jgi:hypothetical protein
VDIKTDDREYQKLSKMWENGDKLLDSFGVDEFTEPYKLVEKIDEVLRCFGFKIERIVKSGKGCYDTPYYFKIKSSHKMSVD